MDIDINKSTFLSFNKDKPDWVKLGKYLNALFRDYVDKPPGISGTFALKIHLGVKGSVIHADFWASPLGESYCTSIVGDTELDVWRRSVKYLDGLRKKATEHKSKLRKKK